jgi:hypothetical protein
MPGRRSSRSAEFRRNLQTITGPAGLTARESKGDIDADESVGFADINPFVGVLTGL